MSSHPHRQPGVPTLSQLQSRVDRLQEDWNLQKISSLPRNKSQWKGQKENLSSVLPANGCREASARKSIVRRDIQWNRLYKRNDTQGPHDPTISHHLSSWSSRKDANSYLGKRDLRDVIDSARDLQKLSNTSLQVLGEEDSLVAHKISRGFSMLLEGLHELSLLIK